MPRFKVRREFRGIGEAGSYESPLLAPVGVGNASQLLVTNNVNGLAGTSADDIVAFRSGAGVWSEFATKGGGIGTVAHQVTGNVGIRTVRATSELASPRIRVAEARSTVGWLRRPESLYTSFASVFGAISR